MQRRLVAPLLTCLLVLTRTSSAQTEPPEEAPSESPPTPAAPPPTAEPASSVPPPATSEEKTEKKEPFGFADFTWLNGNSREVDFPLDTPAFTGQFMTDVNYTYSANHPKDHSLVGSTTTGTPVRPS